MSDVRVLLGDDHTLVRMGLKRILEARPGFTVIAEAANGRDAVQLALDWQPNVAVLDIAMPLLNGIDATRQIVRRAPGVRVLMLSMHQEENYVSRALEAGAAGYLLKDSAEVDLLDGVTAIAQGRSFFSPAIAKLMLNDFVRRLSGKQVVDRYERLSEREREVFQLVAEGRSNKEVAEVLSISPTTVETHRAHILEKLDVHNTAELVLYAVRRGVIS